MSEEAAIKTYRPIIFIFLGAKTFPENNPNIRHPQCKKFALLFYGPASVYI